MGIPMIHYHFPYLSLPFWYQCTPFSDTPSSSQLSARYSSSDMRWGETSPGVIGFISGIVAPQLLLHTAAAHRHRVRSHLPRAKICKNWTILAISGPSLSPRSHLLRLQRTGDGKHGFLLRLWRLRSSWADSCAVLDDAGSGLSKYT